MIESRSNQGSLPSKVAPQRSGRSDNFTGKRESSLFQTNKNRSKKLTICLLCFVAATISLSPYLSFHLTDQVGLLLFEADLVQLRSTQISSIVCFLFCVTLMVYLIVVSNHCDNNIRQYRLLKISKRLIPLAAITSSLAYLSIVLIVPHIKQLQRLPLATFDCDANLITIENCHQPYAIRGNAHVLHHILLGDEFSINQNGNGDNGVRLIRDLNCLRYNDENHKPVQVPTNFLLHSCGLVCKPQRQEYNQFGDDLNTLNWTEVKQNHHEEQQPSKATGQLSLKVCFSDEIGGANYKQYCITNLADHGYKDEQKEKEKTLTLGQLNAILSGRPTITSDTNEARKEDYDSTFSETAANFAPTPSAVISHHHHHHHDDQATHYVNPIVQFESHFKNWPYLSNSRQNLADSANMAKSNDPNGNDNPNWGCQFRPMPPFIVNNKPFSDIKCSIEHEYTMSTGSLSQTDRIYLKKSTPSGDNIETTDLRSERCNIQCKVNILYQIRMEQHSREQHYYLPMKSCNMISGEDDKESIIRQCVIFRSIGDSALIICLILIDLLLLIETIDTKQFCLEQKKSRFLGILLIVLFGPPLLALQFDLTHSGESILGYLGTFFNDNLMPYLHELSQRYYTRTTPMSSNNTTTTNTTKVEKVKPTTFHFDSYLMPVFNFTIIIFIMSISAKDIHYTANSEPVSLVRISSTEELGLATSGRSISPVQQNKTVASRSSNNLDNLVIMDKNNGNKHQTLLDIVLFSFASLFLGVQFYLSLIVQSLILRETFESSVSNNKKYQAFWFEFSTHTGPSFLVAILALFFRDELSSFFANFCPFKSSNNDPIVNKENRAKFLKYICLALTIYSLRSFLLSNLNRETGTRFLMIFLFHLGELFNFPLVWFVLCRRAHELLLQQYPDSWHRIVPQRDATLITIHSSGIEKQASRRTERAKATHLIVQVSLALTYFAIARLVALTLHSLNIGLHLHSDNVDWFITSFQRQQSKQGSTITTTTISQHNNITSDGNNGSLFSPLPSERQTYLHASRLFLKQNSQLCLLMATIMAANLLYVKYQIWSNQKRTLNVKDNKRGGIDDDDNDEFDRQLSLDLMQVRRESRPPPSTPITTTTTTRLIYPSDISNRSETSTSRADTPKARVLFHYELDRDGALNRERSPSTPSVSPSTATFAGVPPSPPPSIGAKQRSTPAGGVRVITINRDDSRPYGTTSESPTMTTNKTNEQEIETTSKYRSKSVQLLEQDEQLDIGIPSQLDDHTNKEADAESEIQTQKQTGRKRTISFAPEATFIGASKGASGQSGQLHSKSYAAKVNSSRTRTIRTASPEPSIEDSDRSG